MSSAVFQNTSSMKQMRRIIAEDPEWNLATVPDLVELCLKHIICNFSDNPILTELPSRHKIKVLNNLAVNIPLKVTANLITDEGYWERCCKARWQVCDVSNYAKSWKRMYFEKNLEEIIEKFVPGTTEPDILNETLTLSKDYIKCLNIKQLLPPVKSNQNGMEEDFSDNESEIGDVASCDHFDFTQTINILTNIEGFHLTYGVKDCGMNFEWDLFEFTLRDCHLLAKALKSCSKLRVFHLHRSKVDDEKARVIISHLIDHPSLEELDLSYNKLSNSSARAIGKMLNGRSRLLALDLTNNHIEAQGAAAIAHALAKNTILKKLNLRLNRLRDEGCQTICRALLDNQTITDLNLGSNDITNTSTPLLAQVLVYNKTMTQFNLSCNSLTEEGGKTLQEGMEDNSTLTHMDLRLTGIGHECEYSINQYLKKNREAKRKKDK